MVALDLERGNVRTPEGEHAVGCNRVECLIHANLCIRIGTMAHCDHRKGTAVTKRVLDLLLGFLRLLEFRDALRADKFFDLVSVLHLAAIRADLGNAMLDPATTYAATRKLSQKDGGNQKQS